MAAPISANEEERLKTLYDYAILDTPPEIAFERITELVRNIFKVPIALVTFVDKDRQWFKSCLGIDIRQTPREFSICAYTIHADGVIAVPDTLVDGRFKDNPLVTGPPNIRSYLGAPLRSPDGLVMGSLCLIDTQPREYRPDQEQMLTTLAAIVVDELDLRTTVRALHGSETKLRALIHENTQLAAAVHNSATGVLLTDPHLAGNPIVYANPSFTAITGYPKEEIIGDNCRFLQGRETDPGTVRQIREAVAEGRPFRGSILNYRKDGTSFWNGLIVSPVLDADGKLINFVGLQNDVTARVEVEHLLREAKRNAEKANERLECRVQERTLSLALSQVEILTRLARASEYRDDDTGQHTQRVANIAAQIAEAMGLAAQEVNLIRLAAPLHDVGKIAISDLILLKPGKLTPEEFEIMKSHATVGGALLAEGTSEVVQVAERIALSHHERWDGSGYPARISGEAIPLEGRILAVADVFDALTHERPYKKAWPVAEAVAEIKSLREQHFSPAVVDAFLALDHQELI